MLLVMAVIFAFSAMPGEESGEASGKLLTVVVNIAEYVTHEPVPVDKAVIIHGVIRKCAHFTEYAILGITAVIAFYFARLSKPKNAILPLAVSVLYAASDEFHQMFVAGRGPSPRDVLIDSIGALTGIVIFLLCIRKPEVQHEL
ncbi:MAG: VanZ family protein [Lachnospiraceae bacterium]|nr:VanZ family protein [Lachnospiraceae bacterium]